MPSHTYDVVIVGAGPAGIFAALELARAGVTNVMIIEKGHTTAKRNCPARRTACVGCKTCDIMTGWGGAGAFSDGKLTLTTEVGGWLRDFVPQKELEALVSYADDFWLEFGATEQVYGPSPDVAAALEREATLAGMKLIPMRIRHLGTDRSPHVLDAMRVHLLAAGVTVRLEQAATRILAENGHVAGVELSGGEIVSAAVVIAAPGREGADWLAEQAHALGLPLKNNAVDIGVRVECPAPIMERLTDALYEAKLFYHTKAFGDTVRTFCMNPHGEVTTESYGDVVTVNGHSYAEAEDRLHQLRGAGEPALHRAVRRPHRLRPLHRQARQPARRRHPRAAPRRPQGRASVHPRAHRAVARRAHARARDAGRPLGGAALPPPHGHHRIPRGDGGAGAGHRRAEHAPVRRRGEVLLVAAASIGGTRDDTARALRHRRRCGHHAGPACSRARAESSRPERCSESGRHRSL